MIALLLCLAMAAAEPAPAPVVKTAVELMDPAVKAARIEKVTADLATKESRAKELPLLILRARPHGGSIKSQEPFEQMTKEQTELLSILPKLRTESRWLRGEVTPASAEFAVKTTKEEYDAAVKANRMTRAMELKLEAVNAELSEVKRLEEAEKPKTPEPN